MATSLSTPGVYIRIQEPAPVLPLSLSITGFVGQATSGPINYPQALANWGQFQDIFGSFTGFSYLSYAVYGFFQNGGIRCHVVRVADESAVAATGVLDTPAPDNTPDPNHPVIGIDAANPGSWGNDVTVTVGLSSGIFTLAQLTQPLLDKTGATITVSTVAGIQAGDSLTLIDPSNPLSRATATVKTVDNAGLTITFQPPLGQTYMAGTKVVGFGFKLTVQYSPGGVLARQEVFDNLSMDPNNPQYFLRIVNGIPEDPDYVNKGLNGQSILIHLVDPVAAQAQQQGKPALGQPRPASGTVTLQNGLDWPSNQPVGLDTPHYTGYISGGYLSTTQFSKWGLAVLEDVPEIGLIAVPDLSLPDLYSAVSAAAIQVSPDGIVFTPIPPDGVPSDNLKQGQSDMLAHCALLQDRFAILDSPRGAQIGVGASPIDDWVSNFRLAPSSKNAALYYPWIREQASDFGGYDLLIPPCGHLAGIYAAVESQRGIGKAPANQVVQGIIDLEFCVSDDQQAVLN
ncbi:MAG: hypothetical protein WB555_09935, partial [Candidatus Korobacteraceae bacterium]